MYRTDTRKKPAEERQIWLQEDRLEASFNWHEELERGAVYTFWPFGRRRVSFLLMLQRIESFIGLYLSLILNIGGLIGMLLTKRQRMNPTPRMTIGTLFLLSSCCLLVRSGRKSLRGEKDAVV